MISYRRPLSLDQFIQPFSLFVTTPIFLFYCAVILINTDVYHILAIVLMLFMISSSLNDMTKGGSVNNLVLLIAVERPGKPN